MYVLGQANVKAGHGTELVSAGFRVQYRVWQMWLQNCVRSSASAFDVTNVVIIVVMIVTIVFLCYYVLVCSAPYVKSVRRENYYSINCDPS